MTRQHRLAMADYATTRAESLARDAEEAARSFHDHHKTARFAEAGSLWAAIARAHAAIAQAMPETETETADA